jgi:site-specific recombinase XerD
VPEVFTAEFEVYGAWLARRGLAEATVRGKTGMLRRFLAFLADLGVREVAALSVLDVSAYVRSLPPMAASSRAGQLYFLREYLRFAVAPARRRSCPARHVAGDRHRQGRGTAFGLPAGRGR